ncbi:putative TB2/DP1, HVA22 family protein [Lyophyllum shimeji]|uniref:Protein YOP1 n=1 Tax=Lyophyllum shimeji TaxID=47721 RepID=A0A9P3UM20_LYOSH|nr:putative TB2/DP1, HVA22 family protein [Lyophyllum shimeji]
MLFYLTARIVSSVAAFLYPGYASYKTLSQRPASEEELERWLMYWSVLGCLIGVEYIAEWLVSWIPFYYPLKALFLLYLALPQTRGSSYIYTAHLHPFFHAHETQIDAALASLKARAYAFVQERLRALWDATAASLPTQSHAQTPAHVHLDPAGTGSAPPPTLGDPASGPAQLVGTLWRSYGPSILASGAALLRSATTSAGAAPGTTPALNTPPASGFTTQSVLERRRRLEAELAALNAAASGGGGGGGAGEPVAFPPANNPSRSSSGLGLRERTNSGSGRFEEVEVPSDVEGYDVGDGTGEGEGEGHARSAAGTRTSWFGWGGSGSGAGKAGYERVKSE